MDNALIIQKIAVVISLLLISIIIITKNSANKILLIYSTTHVYNKIIMIELELECLIIALKNKNTFLLLFIIITTIA